MENPREYKRKKTQNITRFVADIACLTGKNVLQYVRAF